MSRQAPSQRVKQRVMTPEEKAGLPPPKEMPLPPQSPADKLRAMKRRRDVI